MPSVGSRRKGQFVKWSVYLPADLAYRFELLYMDTGKMKPIYGAKGQVLEDLIRTHVETIERRQAEEAIHAA